MRVWQANPAPGDSYFTAGTQEDVGGLSTGQAARR
jgi:hypothetical protein